MEYQISERWSTKFNHVTRISFHSFIVSVFFFFFPQTLRIETLTVPFNASFENIKQNPFTKMLIEYELIMEPARNCIN